MQTAELLTFQQTFSGCPFPEEILTALGSCPVQVRVIRAKRAMEVAVSGPAVSQEILSRAADALKEMYQLHSATVTVTGVKPAAEAAVRPPAQELEAEMAALRRKAMGEAAQKPDGGKKRIRQIYGKISAKKKPVCIGELTLDMGSVLVEGEVFNIEHRELPKRRAWVVCFDITDLTGSVRVTRFMEGEEAKPIIAQVKRGQRLQVQGRLTLGRFDNNDLVLEPYGINEAPKPEGRRDAAPDKRVELHLHTKMSMMDALCDARAVVKRAIEWGHPAVAITDHGVVQSFPDAYSASGRGEKIKILYGVEAYYQNDVDEEPAGGADRSGRKRRPTCHLIVLAKNQTGLRNLYKLVSRAHLEHFDRFPIMPKSLIDENREGLIIGSACEAGELFRAVVAGKEDRELERIAAWYDYLEIQPLSNNAYMLRPNREGKCLARDQEDLRNFNRRVVALGERLGKPVCATGDVHFMDPEEEIYRHVLLSAKEFEDAGQSNPLYFRTPDEMLEEFSYLGEKKAREVVVEGPGLVVGWCENVRPLPDGLFAPKLENSDGELKDLVWGKAHELYGDEPPQIVTDRINAELKDIIGCQYDVIYMSAQKLVQNSLEHGYLVGSRGSVGSSLAAFLSGITEVNSLPAHYRCPRCRHADFDYAQDPAHPYGCGADMPDRKCPVCGADYEKDGFNIPFETFLGFGGDKVPDIDLNFSGEYQSSAHKYTFELFGQDHVFRAGTIGTVAEKTAIGYVRKYLEQTGRDNVPFAEVLRLARGCEGVKRTTGQHPGGMVVIPQNREVYDFCPVQHPADDRNSDIITTHFDYHKMESNLLKLDMLGHDDPSMIRMLEDLTGVDARKIPLDDPDTMSLFTTSEKLGFTGDPILGPTGAVAIPEFGTSFVRGMLEDTRPDQFDVLVRLSGFSHGTDVWLGNAKDLITSGTAKVSEAIGCRDDIMLFLISKGFQDTRAFKIMEAVRKGKGLPEGAEEEMKERGVPQWYIDSCKKIAYLFPKAHAVAYVMMAFRIAWFKVHRPLAFYAAYFSIRAKAFDEKFMCRGMDTVKGKIAEIAAKKNAKNRADGPTDGEEDMLVTLEVCYEFYLRGFRFARMDISRSHATDFLVDEEKGELIPPFTSVAGLGETVGLDIMDQQRQGRDFLSVEEFALACSKVSSAHLAQLREAGAFGDLPESSQFSLF